MTSQLKNAINDPIGFKKYLENLENSQYSIFYKKLQQKIDNGIIVFSTTLASNCTTVTIYDRRRGGIQNLQFNTVEEEEEFYGELNRMEDAKFVEDPEIFPTGLKF